LLFLFLQNNIFRKEELTDFAAGFEL